MVGPQSQFLGQSTENVSDHCPWCMERKAFGDLKPVVQKVFNWGNPDQRLDKSLVKIALGKQLFSTEYIQNQWVPALQGSGMMRL